MKKKLKRSNEFLNQEEDLFELANMGQQDTGLPMIVWISEKRASHGPRVKVSRTYNHRAIAGDTFSIDVSDEPKIVAGDRGDITTEDLQKAFDWVVLNKNLLLQYWKGDILTGDFFRRCAKV